MTATSTISFARGWPSPDLLPVKDLAAAVARALERDPGGALGYGAPEGYAPLREWVAARYGVPVDRVMLTNGSLQGVALVAEHLFAGSGGRAVVEGPTYDRTLLSLRRFGASVEGVVLEADGIDIAALERLLARGVPRLLYLIPNFQNPAGSTMNRAKRERVVALAAEHGFLVFEDDPYRDVRFEGADLPTMLSLDRTDRVIYATSFTKTVAPGVRVGALVLPPSLVAPLRRLANDTYITPTHLAEATVAEYCLAGRFEVGLTHIRAALRARRDALVTAIDRCFGGSAQYVKPEGGYFLWLRLPGVDVDALAERATAAGVPFVKGSACYVDERGRDELRLAFSAVQPADIGPGIERLAGLLPG
jgi:DNA-binding transcriptional MocR family regulator